MMKKTGKMSKADLIAYAVDRFMEEELGKGTAAIIDATAKERQKEHIKAVDELSELVYSEDVVFGSQVDAVVRKIHYGHDSVVVHVGDELYFHGFIEALGCMGIHITREDIQVGIDEVNRERVRETNKWLLDEEAKRISKKFGVHVSISVKEELAG